MSSSIHVPSVQFLVAAFFFFAALSPMHAQQYYKKELDITSGAVQTVAHITTLDGGTLMAVHNSDTLPPADIITLIKLDAGGIMQWTKKYTGAIDNFKNVVQSPDSGYFICFQSYSVSVYHVLKTDKNGDLVLFKQIDLGNYYSIATVGVSYAKNDGGFYIGSTVQYLGNDYWWHLLELDANCNVVESNAYNPHPKGFFRDLDTCSNGDVLLMGYHHSTTTHHTPTVVRIDGNGAVVWSKSFITPGMNIFPSSFVCTPGDFIYIVSEGAPIPLYGNVCLMKIDGNGNSLWTMRYFDASYLLTPVEIMRSPNSDIVITGQELFMKTDSTGIPQCVILHDSLLFQTISYVSPTAFHHMAITPLGRPYLVKSDQCGHICEDTALLVTKVLYTSYDSVINGAIVIPTAVFPNTLTELFSTLHFIDRCQQTSIEETQLPLFTMFPNPASESVNIHSGELIHFVTLYDAHGRIVQQCKPNSTDYTLQIRPAGMYLVRIQTESGVQSERLIVE